MMYGPTPRAQADAGMGEIKRQLVHRGRWRHTQVTLAPVWYPSMRERTWTCGNCGIMHDRNMNAATDLRNLMLPPAWGLMLRDGPTLATPQRGVKPARQPARRKTGEPRAPRSNAIFSIERNRRDQMTQEITQEITQETNIHAAGSSQGNPGPGGYAAIIQAGADRLVRRGNELETSRLRMSLKGIIEALEALREMPTPQTSITIHSDSKYISDAFGKQWVLKWRENGWKTSKGEPIPDPENWENLMGMVTELGKDMRISWASLRGRNDIPGNQQADHLAEEMAEYAATSGENAGRNLNIYVSGITGEESQAGGYAAILDQPGDNPENQVIRGGESNTKSSRMKLQAIILALQEARRKVGQDPGSPAPRMRVHTRSRYIIETMNQGWIERWRQNGWLTNRGEQVKNQDLWKELLNNIQDLEINWIWSKTHMTTPQAELCYEIAGEELQAREELIGSAS